MEIKEKGRPPIETANQIRERIALNHIGAYLWRKANPDKIRPIKAIQGTAPNYPVVDDSPEFNP